MASKRRLKRNGCIGKQQFACKQDAGYVAFLARKRSGHHDIWPYRCLYGKHWHIGHSSSRFKA